jgi:hypothetical protein
MKIPKELYVVQKTELCETLPLGFLNGYEPQSKSFPKKKETMFKWAYSDGWHYIFPVEKDGIVFKVFQERKNGNVEQTLIEAGEQPKIWTNEPMEGFRILTSVSRHATSNKLWRIADPRGIQFEITTGSMEKILEVGTVIKNEIVGKCVWVSNKNLQYVG